MPSKRICKMSSSLVPERPFALAHQLASNFNSLDDNLQSKVLELIDEGLKKDPVLVRTALNQQVSSNSKTARDLYDRRDISGLLKLFDSVTSESAVLLHLEIALVHPAILEASGLLSRTLLPHINALTNFNFITEESHFIFGRFLSSMILHHQDTQL